MRAEVQTKRAMDNMYRWTRHIYDATRKYYLLGRDHLIANINPRKGEIIIEVGCGTARNLRKMAARYPAVHLCGLDASDEMLKTARRILNARGFPHIKLAQGFSQSFDPQKLFGLDKSIDKIVFSYALSIIPPWRDSIDHALTVVKPGGEIHIVDFGGQEDMPPRFRKFLFWWLDKFHVRHRPEVLEYLKRLEFEKAGSLKIERLYHGYAYYAVFRKN